MGQWQGMFKKDHFYIGLIIFAVFFISVNIAWLNPRPEFTIKTHEKIPIMWQYNVDSSHEFLTSAFFPEYYKVNNIRINRPVPSALVKLFGETVGLVISPFIKINTMAKGLIGYAIYKFGVYLLSAILLFKILIKYFSRRIALASVILVYFHPFSILFMTTFVATEFQFINPIIILYLFLNIKDNYSTKKNILFSLLVGTLMLAKQNYAIYIAILLFTFFYKKEYSKSIISFLVHLIPFFAWLGVVKLMGLTYYDSNVEGYGQGSWLLTELLLMNPLAIIQTIMVSIADWLTVTIRYFHIFFILALLAFTNINIKKIYNKHIAVFSLLFICLVWLQFLAARSNAYYLNSDLSIIIFPLGAYMLYYLLDRYGKINLFRPIIIAYILLSLLSMMNFPWIHPYEQVNVLDTKQEKINQINEGNIYYQNNHEKQ